MPIRSWLRPSLRYGSVSTIPLARSILATAAASTASTKSMVPTTCERCAGSATNGVAYSRLLGPAVEPARRVGGARPRRRPARRGRASSRSARPSGTASPPPGCCSVWSLSRVVHRGGQRQERRDPPVGRGQLGDPVQRGRADQRDPQPAVGGEALLRGEVVDVGLARCPRGSPPAPEVASISTSWPSVAPAGRGDRHRDAGRGLVVRPGAARRTSGRSAASGALPGLGRDHHRVGQERARRGCGRRTWRRTRRRSGAARARGPGRTRPRPRTRWCRRCRARTW